MRCRRFASMRQQYGMEYPRVLAAKYFEMFNRLKTELFARST